MKNPWKKKWYKIKRKNYYLLLEVKGSKIILVRIIPTESIKEAQELILSMLNKMKGSSNPL